MSEKTVNGTKKYNGKIIWFDSKEKGYGFIEVEGSNANLFVHVTDVIRSNVEPSALKPGVGVRFHIKPSTKDASKSLASDIELA